MWKMIILTVGFSNFFLATLSRLLWMPVKDLPRIVLFWSTRETLWPVDAATCNLKKTFAFVRILNVFWLTILFSTTETYILKNNCENDKVRHSSRRIKILLLLDFRMLFKTAILIKTKMHSCTFSCNPTCALIRDS